jgi:hypothetical protein
MFWLRVAYFLSRPGLCLLGMGCLYIVTSLTPELRERRSCKGGLKV